MVEADEGDCTAATATAIVGAAGAGAGGRGSSRGVYVNLLQNPETFTGYSGPSARRVWQGIQEENCFGGIDDQCLEKRAFFRQEVEGKKDLFSPFYFSPLFFPLLSLPISD